LIKSSPKGKSNFEVSITQNSYFPLNESNCGSKVRVTGWLIFVGCEREIQIFSRHQMNLIKTLSFPSKIGQDWTLLEFLEGK
jgi:hypothetical protein